MRYCLKKTERQKPLCSGSLTLASTAAVIVVAAAVIAAATAIVSTAAAADENEDKNYPDTIVVTKSAHNMHLLKYDVFETVFLLFSVS